MLYSNKVAQKVDFWLYHYLVWWWPRPSTFLPQNLINSSLSPNFAKMWIWWMQFLPIGFWHIVLTNFLGTNARTANPKTYCLHHQLSVAEAQKYSDDRGEQDGGLRSVVSRPAHCVDIRTRTLLVLRDWRSHRTARSCSCDCVTRRRCWTSAIDASLRVQPPTMMP